MRSTLLAAVFFVAQSLVAQDSALSIEVIDQAQGALSNAVIAIHWDSAGSEVGLTTNVGIKQSRILKAGNDGRVKLELPPGFYDVFVTSNAFRPQARKIRLKGGESNSIRFVLKLEPIVTRELGTQVQ